MTYLVTIGACLLAGLCCLMALAVRRAWRSTQAILLASVARSLDPIRLEVLDEPAPLVDRRTVALRLVGGDL